MGQTENWIIWRGEESFGIISLLSHLSIWQQAGGKNVLNGTLRFPKLTSPYLCLMTSPSVVQYLPTTRSTIKAQPQAQGRVTTPLNLNLNSKTLQPTPIIIYFTFTYLLTFAFWLFPSYLSFLRTLLFPLSFMSPSHIHIHLSLSLSPLQGQSSSQPLSQPTHP